MMKNNLLHPNAETEFNISSFSHFLWLICGFLQKANNSYLRELVL